MRGNRGSIPLRFLRYLSPQRAFGLFIKTFAGIRVIRGQLYFPFAMTTELGFLVASIILGLVHLIVDSHLISLQYGYRWTASNREEPVPPLRGLASRVDQAYTNFIETFPFFAALVLAVYVTGSAGTLTLWGAHLYFWGRLGYLLAAALGYGLLRSTLFFNAALAGILLFLIALLR